MMMKNLVLKTLYDRRWFAIGWASAFFFMSLLVVLFYPSFSSSFQIDQMTANLPDALKGFLGDVGNLKTIKGYLADQLYNIRIPLFMLIMAIVLGLGLSVTDEESGKLRTLLSAPISRSKVLLSRLAAAILIIGFISLATTIATYIGILLIHESSPHLLIWQLFGLSWLFGSVAVSIVIGIGTATGNRALTTGTSLFITIGSFILSTFGVAVSWLQPYEKYSLLHYYNATGLVKNTFEYVDFFILLIVLVISSILGLVRFRKRDVR